MSLQPKQGSGGTDHVAVAPGGLRSAHPIPGRYVGCSEKCRRGMLLRDRAGGNQVKSHKGTARWELEVGEKRSFGDLLQSRSQQPSREEEESFLQLPSSKTVSSYLKPQE